MKDSVKFSIQNVHIRFQFTIERNITIITGDSGTGKTKLINMVRQYEELGRKSGVKLSCDKKCYVLDDRNWEFNLNKINNGIIFIEESTKFLVTHEFAKAIQGTTNYYVIITREPLPQLPYAVKAIKQIDISNKNPKITPVYKNISTKKISDFPYDIVIVEDSQSGFQFFKKATEKLNVNCVTSNGKSGILKQLYNYSGKKILVIADSAALGSEIKEIVQYKSASTNKIDLFLPESFEWLILCSNIINNSDIDNILTNPIKHIECEKYFSWEKYFEAFLTSITKESRDMKYCKKKLAKGYIKEDSIKKIIEAME